MKQGREKKRAGKREAATAGLNPWGSLAQGMVFAVLSTVCLLGVFAVLISTAVLPVGMMNVCVPVSCGAGTLLGGRLATKGGGKERLLWGVGVGGGMMVALAVAGVLCYDGLELMRGVAIGAACLAGGLLSGVLGKNTGRKRRT